MSQRTKSEVQYYAAVVEEFLKLGGGCSTVMRRQVSLASKICRVERSLLRRRWLAQFVGSSSVKKHKGLGRITTTRLDGCLERGQPIDFQHRIRRVALLQLLHHKLCPGFISDPRQGHGCQHLDISSRSQSEGCGYALLGRSNIAEFGLPQGSIYLPQGRRLPRVRPDCRVHRPAGEVPCFGQPSVIRLGVGLGRKQRVFGSRLSGAPSQLLFHLRRIPLKESKVVHPQAQ